MADHPIFDDIDRNDLEAVTQHVLADSAVLEERTIGWGSCTPLCYAIREQKTAIAHWLIEHRGQHDIGTQARQARCPLHLTCYHGPLSVVQALVAAGPNSIALDIGDCTPLIYAVEGGHTDTVRRTMDAKSACSSSSTPAPTPPSPAATTHEAIRTGHEPIAILLLHVIMEPHRARTLHKARALLDAGITIPKARRDVEDIFNESSGSEGGE